MHKLIIDWKKILFLFVVIIIGNLLFPRNTVFARDGCYQVAPGFSVHSRTIVVFYDNSSGRSWGVYAHYNAHPSSYDVSGSSFSSSGNDLVVDCYIPEAADSIEWHTACVDPAPKWDLDLTSSNCGTDSCTIEYRNAIDVDCHNMGDNGTANKVYAGCGTNSSQWNQNFGFTGASANCPTDSPYCADGGVVNMNACNGGSYLTCANNCSRVGAEHCASSGISCVRYATDYNVAACDGTSGCCHANSDCGANQVCNNNGDCVTHYACNNGTGFCSADRQGNSTDKATCDSNCIKDTKDLVVSALTFPSGIRGTIINQNNLILSIKNTGNSQITGDFTVRLCNGDGVCGNHLVQQTVSANEVIDLSGVSEFNLPRGNPAGSYTAKAIVDYDASGGNGNIAEDDETNNDRTDTYTTTNPDCDSGKTCGVCSVACGTGTQTCTFTTYSGGGTCNVVGAPSQSCSPTCPGGKICVSNACITPTCNTGTVCGACSVACGTGTKSCVFTTYNDGPIACTQTGAPPQTCAPTCPAGTPDCVANTCVCSAVGVPTGLAPSGDINDPQGVGINITWNAVAGATSYALRVDDLTNGWTGTCASVNPGDVCTDIAGTAYTYYFQPGHTYSIWVHSISACGAYSASTSTNVNVKSFIWGHIFIDNNNDTFQNDVAGYANDTNYAGNITKTGGTTENYSIIDGSGNYIFWENNGTYTVSIPMSANYIVYPFFSQTTSVGPSQVLSFRLVPLSYIWGHVYIDNDNSGSENAGDGVYAGLTVNLSGAASRTTTTDASGNYGFWSLLPGGYTTSFTTPGGYIAPVTQQSTTLPPDRVLSYRLIPVGVFNPKGNHDSASCTVTTGWTCDPDNYGQAIDVHFYKDTLDNAGFMGAVTANGAREAAVGAQCGGNSNHGFTFNMPVSVYDGTPHNIYAFAINIGNGDGTNPLLWSSPKPITCARSIVNIHVYNDNNGNGVEDVNGQYGFTGPTETGSSGKIVSVAGGGGGTYITDENGNVQITNLLPGSSTATVIMPPGGWTATTANPATAVYPPSPAQLNFGIKPPAPTCSGGLTANPTSVNPGQSSTLTAAGCTSPTGQVLNYTFFDDATIAGDTVTNTNVNTSTWGSPNPYWTAVTAHPSVSVCNPGGSCTPYSTAIDIVPLYSITGNVFVDINKDTYKNGAETNYTPITITSSDGSTPTYSNGAFTVANLPAGSYIITYTNLPVDYKMTYPSITRPYAFNVTVGAGCSAATSNSATCADGNISNLNFGIIYGSPWIQSGGSDMWFNGGFSDTIPTSASCQSYASVIGPGGTPGIIYSNGAASFGQGQASVNNWTVNSIYIPVTPNSIRSSFSYMSALIAQNHITPINMNTNTVCPDLTHCTLPANLANGVYIANGDVTLTGASYRFLDSKNYVFLINGNLTINNEIHVPKGSAPVKGSTALFTALKDITIGSNVGETDSTSKNINLEGWYSAGEDFIIPSGATCPTADRRLNVAGAIVVNAELKGGSFVNQRDLCAGNLSCPVFYIEERPDFTLNAPTFLQSAPRIWQEVAP